MMAATTENPTTTPTIIGHVGGLSLDSQSQVCISLDDPEHVVPLSLTKVRVVVCVPVPFEHPHAEKAPQAPHEHPSGQSGTEQFCVNSDGPEQSTPPFSASVSTVRVAY